MVGEGVCAVKTLTRNHLYCEPPPQQPAPVLNGKKREGSDNLPEFTVSLLCRRFHQIYRDSLTQSHFSVNDLIEKDCVCVCVSGQNGQSELLLGKSPVRQPGPGHLPCGGSDWSWCRGVDRRPHCSHHRAHLQVIG